MKESSRRLFYLGALFTAILIYVSCTMISYQPDISNSNQRINPASRRESEESLASNCNLDGFVLEPTLNQTDPCLVAFLKKKLLVAPRSPESVKTIAFSSKQVDIPCNIDKLKWIQMLVMDGAPKGTQFFFVESGAHDGRFISSTVRLETLYGWNGVLIEPLPIEFKKILENRKVWAVNAALCTTPHPNYVDFFLSDYKGSAKDLGFRSGSRLLEVIGKNGGTKLNVPCVPFYTILTALNVTVVDYLSLDIEGAELLVLKTVPFDKVKFKVVMIEFAHIPGENPIGQLEEFFKPLGYHLVANIAKILYCDDSVFVHESVYQQKKSIINYLNTI